MLKLLQTLLPGVLAFSALILATPAMAHKEVGLSDVTVLIVRHAEKPDQGRGLSPAGEHRAQAYASYFDPLSLDGAQLTPQRLIATSDSKESDRPRLTLTPLSQRLNLPIEQPYADDEVDKLVKSLGKDNSVPVVLIAWHHGHIDNLIEAFGGDAKKLTGQKHWPEDVYDWLIVLRFDHKGQLIESRSEKVDEPAFPG
ncbi:MAG: flagellar basal body-associated protein FliL [Pseudomonas gingeri]